MLLLTRNLFLGGILATILSSAVLAQNVSRESPVVKVVRDNAGSVVNISTERIVLLQENPYWGSYGSEFDIFFDRFFGYYSPKKALKFKSVGSGVIVDNEGIVVTNSHVVNKASNIFIILNNGTRLEGQLVYENPRDDLAIIKIDPVKDIQAIKLGKTDDIMVGETVVAIGNPLGLENSVTAGVISGKNRNFYDNYGNSVVDGLLQTDAPINPGNSGGALINIHGELIGVNVAVVENSQSIGFAIPVEKVKEAMEAHKQNKTVPSQRIPHRIPKESPAPKSENWDPYQDMAQMRKEMDEKFESFLDRMDNFDSVQGKGSFKSGNFFDSNVDLEEKDGHYLINMDISELDKNKINVEINEDSITISGEYSQEVSEESSGRSMQSHSYGSMLKSLPMPDDADIPNIKSEVKGERLLITIPKKK